VDPRREDGIYDWLSADLRRRSRGYRVRTCDCMAPGAIRGHRDGDETCRRGLRVFARVSRGRRRRQLVTDSDRSGEALKSQEIYTAKNNREASMKSLHHQPWDGWARRDFER